ncbi:hypothetical protein OIE69_44590 (plasmid) [Actinacidiphila glaucinigra]|uniref:hypothetical protein n=1 Tax=Actinacidiphila glaucinigra TaxID=235986 RepID=UPI002DD7B7FB|nr:hypothetical protein [Actinacidiphila glaucinigra]WSD65729.1 hypothetical protein OIE69_43260 [Actinacidiphila glaucinigra]WSD65983.1 hypothetical protein OIE69_44590 [Actinacidiphila glaucinigra]
MFELLTTGDPDEEADEAETACNLLVPEHGSNEQATRAWLAQILTNRALGYNEEFAEYTGTDYGCIDLQEHHAWALLSLGPLPRRLRLLQTATKSTAVSLSRALDVGKHQIDHWASGRSAPRPERREALAAALGVHPAWLATDRDDCADSPLYVYAACPCGTNAGFTSGPLEGDSPRYIQSLDSVQPVQWCDGCGQPYLSSEGLLMPLPVTDETMTPGEAALARGEGPAYSAALVDGPELGEPWPHGLWSPGATPRERGAVRVPDLLKNPPRMPEGSAGPSVAVPQQPRRSSAGSKARGGRDAVPPELVHQEIASQTFHPGGRVTTERAPAVWTLAHKGYSGSGRLDVWVYYSEKEALRAGAELAMACGMDEDAAARAYFAAGCYREAMARYEATHGETHLLRVQSAFVQDPGE